MLRLRLAWVKHITLALFASALLAGAVEVGLRVHHSWETQAQLEREGSQSLAVASWKCHHALKPLKSTVCRNPDTRLAVGIRTNSLGLRGEPISIPKPRDVFRIIYLGDEAVFAAEVAEEETFCRLMAQQLARLPHRRIEVVNGGVPGYCPLLSYLQFKHSLAGLQPDLLILNLDMSDVADDHQYRRHARLGADGLPLVCAHPTLHPPPHRADSFSQRLLLLKLLKQQMGLLPADEQRVSDRNEIASAAGRYAWTREKRPDWEVYLAQALAPVVDLRNLANQLSCPLVVSLSPVPWQVSERAMPDLRAREQWGIAAGQVYDPELSMGPVTQFLEAHSIAYCDLSGAFRESQRPERLFHETVPRFSRDGHLLFARTISRFLQESQILVQERASGD